MVRGPARRAVVVLGCLLTAGSAGAFPQDEDEAFAAAWRKARVVAILPPLSVVRYHPAGDAVRPDWSEAGYENVAKALQAALEERGLEVVWVHPTPEAEPFIDGLTDSILAVVDGVTPVEEMRSAADRRFVEHEHRYRQAVLALLLRATGADLILLARAEGMVQSAERASQEAFSRFITGLLFGDPGPEVVRTWSDVQVLIAEPGGKLVYRRSAVRGALLMDEASVKSIVDEAMEGLPRPTHDKPFGAKCVLSSECQPGLYCPYGRCLRGEDPALPR